MKNKGFTLIELLAVIVILAIIALIATPIILGIINDARDEAKRRSAESVAHAMETAYLTTYTKEAAKGEGILISVEKVIGNVKVENEATGEDATTARAANKIKTKDGVTCELKSDWKIACTGMKEAMNFEIVTE